MASRSKFIKVLLLPTLIISLFVGIDSQLPAQAQTPAPPNVIAIGDSITDDFGNGGWRGPLKTKLAAVGQAINYVGARSDGAGSHESYGGASSCDFSTDRGSFMADTYGKSATWDIRAALAAASPNIAIVYIGTNNYIEDTYLAQGLATTVPCGLNSGSLHWLWDTVVYHPGITGVVITTVEDAMIPNGTENVNALVRKYVADRQAQGKNVCLGELPSDFAGLTTDQYHLNAAGKDAVATALLGPTWTAIAGTCAANVTTTLPAVALAASIANAAEPSTNGQFTVSRTGSVASPLTVNFTVSGSATAASDYANIGTSVVIPAGSATAAVAVNVIDDTIYEGSETVVVTLSPNASYAVGSSNSATVTIADNEAAATISVSPNGASPGDLLTVTWSGIANPAAHDWLGLYAAGAASGSYITWVYVSCGQGATIARVSGTCVLPLPSLANGNYEFRLFSNNSYNVIALSNPLVVGLAVPVVSIAATANAAEPSTNGQFTVTRTGSTVSSLTVNFAASGSATPGTDYNNIGGSVVIPAGSAAATLAVNVIDDAVYEVSETVVVTLSAQPAYIIGSSTATVTIADDDRPVVSIVATDAAAAEAGLDTGTFTVSRDGITTALLTVNYAVGGTAINGVDYQLLTGSLTIPAGQALATIVVTPIDDSLFEGVETVIVTLSNNASYVLGTPNNATVTIADDDKPMVSIVATDSTAAEAGFDPGVFTVTRDGITTGALTVDYSLSGTANNGVDYQPLSGTLTIPAGQASATIVVTPIDDNIYEGHETVVATLNSNANYVLSTPNNATVTIADDDKPVVSIVATDSTAAEAGLDPGVFTVTRDGITTGALTVDYSLSGTANNGVDYQPLSGTLTIPAGQASATIVVTPIDDSASEGNETVVATLNSNANYVLGTPNNATVTVADDDKPVVSIVATSATAAEAGLDPGVLTVSRDGITTAPLTVNYTMSGTASNGVDYQLLSGSLTMSASQASATIVVTPIDDSLFEGVETVIVTLSSNANYVLGTPNNATVTIADDDKPVVSIVATDSTAAEAGLDTGTFTVSRDGITTAPLTVNYAVGGTASNGVDYQSLSSSLTIPAGQASATIVVTPIDDSASEGNETVVLTLATSGGYILGSPNSATVTIADNDQPAITVSPTTFSLGSTITVTWSGIVNPTATDWIGLYAVGAPDLPYWAWEYVSCSGTPTVPKAQGSCTFSIPAAPSGSYELRLFRNNGFTRIVTTNPLTLQ